MNDQQAIRFQASDVARHPSRANGHSDPSAVVASSTGGRLESMLRARNIHKIYPLAIELGINESCISRWRKGGAISTVNAINLCRMLDVCLDWFLTGRGHMDQHKTRYVTDQEFALIENLRLLPKDARNSLIVLVQAIGLRVRSPFNQ